MKNSKLKKMPIGIMFWIAMSMFMVACNKEVGVASDAYNLNGTKSYGYSPEDSIAFGLPRNSLEMMADSHNYYLAALLDEFDYTNSDIELELEQCFELIPQSGPAADMFDSIWGSVFLSAIEDVDIEDVIYELGNLNEPEQVFSLLTTIDAERIATISSHYQLHCIADSIMAVANYNLTDGDLLVVDGYIHVLERSAKFWLPTDKGGQGNWDLLCDRMNGNEPQPPQDSTNVGNEIGEVVLADCLTAAVGCIITAVGAIIAPEAAVALLGITAKESAKQSAKAAIRKAEEHTQSNNNNGN